MLDLLTLKSLPPPLVDVFYYDGPMDFLSLEGESILYLTMREQDKGLCSWFCGVVSEEQVRDILLGKLTKCEATRKFCTHKIDWQGSENVKVSVCSPDDYAPDYLAAEGWGYGWTPEQVDEALYDVRHGGEKSC